MPKNKILIVDDETLIVRLLAIRLEANDFEIYKASDGVECLQIAEREIPDLILLDISMPYMDGVQTYRNLIDSHKTKLIPVIFLTGLASEKTRIEVQNMGAADYL